MKQDAAQTHGLDGQLVAPDWPVLQLEEVDRLLRRFPKAERAERILSISPRPFSAASVVATPRSKVFVKRHHCQVRDRSALLEEHRWLSYLSNREPLVQAPLQTGAGETAVSIDAWTYEVHPICKGVDLYEQAHSWTPFLSRGQARNAGRALARLHAASSRYDAPARNAPTLLTSFSIFSNADPWPALSHYIEMRPALRAYLKKRNWMHEAQKAFRPWHERLLSYLHVFQPLWTHNDFHASNLMWSDSSPEAQVTDIFDMGLCDRTTAIHDVATAIERNGVEWLRIQDASYDPLHLEHIDALLHGYEELRPLSRKAAESLVALLPLVHAEFALSETDYFLRLLNSEEKADLAYLGYFLDHARWFGTEPGKRLLDHLQAWAGSHPTTVENGSTLVADTQR